MEFVLSLLIGISLSATSGFRVFVPLLMLSIASLAGWVELSSTFDWIGTYPVLAALAVAAVVELLAYFFPVVDNMLGAVSVPLSMLAGILITASVLVELPPLITWALAVVAGGGAALGGSAASNIVHAGSTTTTAGTANPIISFIETVFSLIMSILAVLVPVLAFLLLLYIILIIFRVLGRVRASRAGNLQP